jgi:GH25 family lysozyme M1 (1,4-beta-N-acetylmuramidase)
MALNNYILNGPSTVILDDNRDPYVSWQHHLDRTGRGGVDLVAQTVQPVLAPTPGWVRRRPNNGSAGNSMWFEHELNPGWGDVFSHLSSYVGGEGQYFAQGQVIAYTGSTGGVSPHLHRHLEKGGARYNPWDYFSGSGGGGTVDYAYGLSPECQGKLQEEMHPPRPYYTGPIDNVFGEKSVKGMQQQLKDLGYLAADYEVDGVPGPLYGGALQKLAYDRGNPLYRGPMDNEPGAKTSESLIGWANGVIAGSTPVPPDPTPEPEPEPVVPVTPAGTKFGVDVGTSQASMDFTKFALAGGAYAIAKMGGGNASDSPYVAPEYRNQLPRIRAAGLKVGHYWFNGDKNGLTPQASAEFFINNIDLLPGEVIALDIENETATGTPAYTPEEALAFAKEVDRLRPGLRGVAYMSAGLVRSGEWDALRDFGWELWVAMYDDNDGTIPEEGPVFDDWTDYAIWQYSSTVVVPGFSGPIDANIVRDGVWERLGYTERPVEPEPEPDDDTRDVMRAFLVDLGASATATAAKLA